ncbi:MAG: hypothetical protein CVT64_10190 [Actinobacteria bacterium HGW-Actinobacteria-4]|nr:MAG: hypothetical protein CVT64_10190 [Actinobacteria bacterium HGW-Actinobacteria-4]
MADQSWPEQRGEAALKKADALARKRHGETLVAAKMVREFADRATAAGITPVQFSARTYDGNARYRTHIYGWYLKKDRSVGVSTDGVFYVLTAPRRFMSHFTGTHVEPAEPPLELGKGGRDGESMPIETALAKRLAAGNDWV